MQVLLRDSSGLFYAGKELRTADSSTAADFRDITIAAQLAVDQNLPAPQVVLNYRSPPCQLALPLSHDWFPCDLSQRLVTVARAPSRVSPHDNLSSSCYFADEESVMPDKMVILLVEDREDDILLVHRAFAAAKLSPPIHAVRNGEEAIEYLLGTGKYSNRAEYPLPDLILLDLKMPRMTGIEVLRWIRSHADFKTLRVIVLTSSEDIFDVNLAYQAGANSFLVKPLEFENYPAMMQTLTTFWRSSPAPAVDRPEKTTTSPRV